MTSKDILCQLIAMPSTSGHEAKIQKWVITFLKGAGLHPHLVKDNVVCCIPGVGHAKALIFNGHVDTVEAGDRSAWQTGPFDAVEKDGKVFGLGASDMKSGVAVMLMLAEYYSQHKPAVDVWLHFVVQEETTAQGTHDVMEWFQVYCLPGYKEVAGVLLEPTSLACLEIAHKGNIFLELTVKGDSGHGSTPEVVQENAVEKMIAAKTKLEELVGGWGKIYGDPLLGVPTVALTSIQAGSKSSPNKIAGTCSATFDLRTTPGVHDHALDVIGECLGDEIRLTTVYEPQPCGYTSENERIVQIAKRVTNLPAMTTPGSTDMLFFTALGIPATILGPGEKSVEHKANEYVELGKTEKAFDQLVQIVAAYQHD